MKPLFNKRLDAATFARIKEVMDKLEHAFGEDYKLLPWRERYLLALQTSNAHKTVIVKGRLIFDALSHVLPWIVALVALLR